MTSEIVFFSRWGPWLAAESYRIVRTMKKWSERRTSTVIYSSQRTAGRTHREKCYHITGREREWCVDDEHNESTCSMPGSCCVRPIRVCWYSSPTSMTSDWRHQKKNNLTPALSQLSSRWTTDYVWMRTFIADDTPRRIDLCMYTDLRIFSSVGRNSNRKFALYHSSASSSAAWLPSRNHLSKRRELQKKDSRKLPEAWREERSLDPLLALRKTCVC